MLPTPSTAHVNYDQIYEPAEDSFLLLDTVSSEPEIAFLRSRFHPKSSPTAQKHGPSTDVSTSTSATASPLILEVGTGSGVVLAFVAANAGHILGRDDVLIVGTDVNKFACQAARSTILRACEGAPQRREQKSHDSHARIGTMSAVLVASLTRPLRDGTVDLLIFNPPYVPSAAVPTQPPAPRFSFTNNTMRRQMDGIEVVESKRRENDPPFERDVHLLSLSYEGGIDGMEVTNALLDELPRVLCSTRGVAYVLLCRQNKPEEVVERVRCWGRAWTAMIVNSSGNTAGWEKLVVVRIERIAGELGV